MAKQEFRPVDAHVLAALLEQVSQMLDSDGAFSVDVSYDGRMKVMLADQAFRRVFSEWRVEIRTGDGSYPIQAVTQIGEVKFAALIAAIDMDQWPPAVPATA